MNTTFVSLRQANIARNREWWKSGTPATLSFRGNELAGEAGEAIAEVLNTLVNACKFSEAIGRASNVIKKLERERLGIGGSRASVADLAAELADANICLDLIAMDAGIDLEAATVAKFNATSQKNGLETRLAAPLNVAEPVNAVPSWPAIDGCQCPACEETRNALAFVESLPAAKAAPVLNAWQSHPLAEIIVERQRQDEQWGGPAHDDTHNAADWLHYICQQLTKIGFGIPLPQSVHFLVEGPARQRLVKIAALAVAALESMDRKAAAAKAA